MRFAALQDSGLAFLFTLAAVPMAGCPIDLEPSDTESGASDDSSSTTMPSGTSAPTSSPETMASSTTADPSGDTDPTGDAETTTAGTDPTGEPTGGGGGQICEAYAAHIVLCEPELAPKQSNFVGYCMTSLDYYASISPACLAAAEDLFACLITVDCDVFLDDGNCPEETAELEACS